MFRLSESTSLAFFHSVLILGGVEDIFVAFFQNLFLTFLVMYGSHNAFVVSVDFSQVFLADFQATILDPSPNSNGYTVFSSKVASASFMSRI
jgi:hypothetical protein